MRRNVVGSILGVGLGLLLVSTMSAQGLAEVRPESGRRKLPSEEIEARNRHSGSVREAHEGFLTPRLPKKEPDSSVSLPVQLHQSDLSATKGVLDKYQSDGFLPLIGLHYASQTDPNPVELVPPVRLSGSSLSNSSWNLSGRYRLSDASGTLHYRGDSQQDLSATLNQMLSAGAGQSIAVDLSGFSEDKAEALATSLRLQHVSIRILPHPAEDGTFRGILSPPIWLERTDSQNAFAGRLGQQVKQATGWIVEGTKELVKEFFALLFFRLRFDFDSQQSLSKLVAAAHSELKAKNKNLTNEQFRLKVKRQFGTIDLSLLRPELAAARS